ncbi:MAG: hypothetical protein WC457_03850 [Patescibacteria group bacterium]
MAHKIFNIYLRFIFAAIVVAYIFAFNTPEARCAQLYFESQTPTVSVDDELFVSVYLNTDEEVLNAFEGKVFFPKSLELIDISDGGSVINLWVRKPAPDYFGIFFSGVTPGGFYGTKGKLFDIKFRAVASGAGKIIFSDLLILKNDGLGTPTEVSSTEWEFIVNEGVGIQPKLIGQEVNFWEDVDPPESFTPIIDRSPEIFDNRWFLSFTAQDKNSGIDRYEKKSAKSRIGLTFAKWREVGSPLVLSDQNLESHILIKAVDKAGNERIESVEPAGQVVWYKNLDVWMRVAIIAFCVILVGRILCLLRRKFRKPA